ncbi:MAG TPA: M56 family metallopeptidase [Steroidobacteraceae bacterium]|nr:M56 family metallopeptidase [Steroidobacteraceae bacterium]
MIAALINHLWQSTLFCGGAWLITLALRANSASLRHWIWLLASVKFLVPFSLLFIAGSYIGLPAARIADNQPLILGVALQSVSPLVSPSALQATESGAGSTMLIVLLALWLGGALVVGLRWLLAWRAADSLVRAARPAPGALLDARITDAEIEPAVARVFHPVVLLPAALLERLSRPEIDAVLAHEHEHIARHDNLKDSIHRVVETLFWFHPAVWWIGRLMIEERERACDEAVLASGHDGGEYASGILAVCRHCHASTAASAAATSGDLTRRVRYILGNARPAALGAAKALTLLVATLAAATIPMFAGAVDGTARRHELLTLNSRALGGADFSVVPATGRPGTQQRIDAARDGVIIRNTTLRDLIALSYGVERWHVSGDGQWLDTPRYDIRAVAHDPVSEPDELDPYALRVLTTRLLASRFDLEIHVNRRCQSPCGRYALTAAKPTQ